MTLAVRGPTPAGVSDRVRKIAMSVDPTLRLATIRTLEQMLNDGVKWDRLGILWIVMVMLSVILLSAAGIYALMSFTVTRRQREIGIRSALGAPRRRVLAEVLSRAMRQIGIGIAIGIPGSGIVYRLAGESDSLRLMFLVQPAAMMVVVGLIATIGPARRALRVQPTEALRTD
jgi:ABC-type antimicrobial peptide transport system permease subunit